MSTLYWYGLLCLIWLVGWLVTPIVSIVTANSQPESRGANRWQMESQTQRTDNLRTMSCLDAFFWLNITIYFHFEPTLYLSVNVSVPLLVYFHDSTSGCAVNFTAVSTGTSLIYSTFFIFQKTPWSPNVQVLWRRSIGPNTKTARLPNRIRWVPPSEACWGILQPSSKMNLSPSITPSYPEKSLEGKIASTTCPFWALKLIPQFPKQQQR